MAATIGDVARLAGVGRGTVSRVLNERANVDPATRARVLTAIHALDYVPSAAARRLSLGRTQTIAVILPFLTRPSVVERLRGIEAAVARSGFDMIVFNVETPERRTALFRDLPRRERVDGTIVVSLSPSADEVERIRRTGLPTILIDGHHRALPRIVGDDVGGGRLATDHLIALGHRRIGFIGEIPRPRLAFRSTRLRMTGVRRSLSDAGLTIPARLIGVGDHTRGRAAELARRMLLLPMPPTAIVCASDTQAAGVLEAAATYGIAVPGLLSVTGYDDLELADHLGLTTIRQPLFDSGRRAVERLLASIEGRPGGPLRELQDIELVVRRTTAPASL
ncbi:MAG: LacI family DNA-binding transcriptional regulator [Candidatus Limnocylindrales bacterium]